MDNIIKYIAHINEDNQVQCLQSHLSSVAKIASCFANKLTTELAYHAGALHDLGKYSLAFQHRIRGSSIQVEHSLAGALFLEKAFSPSISRLMLQYVILGHHSGLPDGGTPSDLDDTPTLHGRLKRVSEDYSAYQNEYFDNTYIPHDFEQLFLSIYGKGTTSEKIEVSETFAFFTRYVFSCLTDADFLDTESFCYPNTDRKISSDFVYALKLLDTKINTFKADTKVNKARAALFNQIKNNSIETKQINLINMPTGSGKTLTSLRAALDVAIREKKKRIIYIIPYTSIIEQTAQEFEHILNESVTILQHHSNYDLSEYDKKETQTTLDKLKKATENWDCPLIITTSVQFFESAYHYKGSKLRKLHNLSDSILVFDEIHMLPIDYLQPCIRAVGFITKFLNSKAFFLSATMPNYEKLFQRYIPKNSIKKLITNTSYYESFKNTSIHYLDEISSEALITMASKHNSSLIICNTRKSARTLYKLCNGSKYHLSTYMTPKHRSKVISDVRNALKNNEKITLISTSLIEAGVDLDFETVYRELAGLDNILQSAGRCNREGKRQTGHVYVYQTNDKPTKEMQLKSSIALNIIKNCKTNISEEAINTYFERLYSFNLEQIDKNSIAFSGDKVLPFDAIPFRSYAEKFNFIDENTIGIVINNTDECKKLLNSLKFGAYSAKRSLQQYTVSIKFYEFENAYKQGLVYENNGVFVLSDHNYYNRHYGLSLDETHDDKYIFQGG